MFLAQLWTKGPDKNGRYSVILILRLVNRDDAANLDLVVDDPDNWKVSFEHELRSVKAYSNFERELIREMLHLVWPTQIRPRH